MLERIISESDDPKDLPWVNDYIDSIGDADDSFLVSDIKKTASGYLILTSRFKGFIFKDSKLHGFLSEAIPLWKHQKELPYAVFGIALSNGKIDLAVDRDYTSVPIVDKKGNVTLKSPDAIDASSQQESNIFTEGLNVLPIVTTVAEKVKKPSTSRNQTTL